jgi:hypothetical protein
MGQGGRPVDRDASPRRLEIVSALGASCTGGAGPAIWSCTLELRLGEGDAATLVRSTP